MLLGLTYWMSAPAPLPDPNLLIHPQATGWLVIRAAGLEELPQDTLQFLTGGAPPQIERLVALASRTRSCPIQIVLSAFPGEHGREKSLAVSLGRFPGRFWLVRRDLERRVERQALPLSLRYRRRMAIFFPDEPSNPLNTLSLAECTLLRCANPAAAETLIDRLGKKAGLSADRRQRAPAALPPGGFQGWAETWQQIPLEDFFPADSALAGYWQSLTGSLAAQFPALARCRDVRFRGTFQDARRAEMQVSLQTDTPGATSLAAKLGDWLTGRKVSGYVQVGSSGSIEVTKLELHFAKD